MSLCFKFVLSWAAMLAMTASLAAQDAIKIEFGRVYSFEEGASAGHFDEIKLVGLENAKSLRATASVIRQERHPRWAPTLLFLLGPSMAAIEDRAQASPAVSISGLGAMDVEAYVKTPKGSTNSRTFKRKLSIGQNVNVELIWDTVGKLVVQIDGQERHTLPMPQSVGAFKIIPSTGQFRIDDLVFHQR